MSNPLPHPFGTSRFEGSSARSALSEEESGVSQYIWLNSRSGLPMAQQDGVLRSLSEADVVGYNTDRRPSYNSFPISWSLTPECCVALG